MTNKHTVLCTHHSRPAHFNVYGTLRAAESYQSSLKSDSRATLAVVESRSLSFARHWVRNVGQLLRKNCFWLTHSRHVTIGNNAWQTDRQTDRHVTIGNNAWQTDRQTDRSRDISVHDWTTWQASWLCGGAEMFYSPDRPVDCVVVLKCSTHQTG